MDGMLTSVLRKENGKLVHVTQSKKDRYKDFVDSLEEGTQVHLFIEIDGKKASLATISKVHKCIRVLALHTGTTFKDMKLVIKKNTGLMIIRNEDNVIKEKSFGDCSQEEVNLAIQSCIEIGDMAKINLR